MKSNSTKNQTQWRQFLKIVTLLCKYERVSYSFKDCLFSIYKIETEANQKLGIPGGSVVKNLPAMQETGDASSIPGSGRSPGGGNSYPLYYSCLENPMDRAALWTTVYKVAKRWT